MNWSHDDPRRFAIRLDAEAIAERGRAIAALYNHDTDGAEKAFGRAARLMEAAGWAALSPGIGLELCEENGIDDIR
jgi:DnaJ-domain-containing protein 1